MVQFKLHKVVDDISVRYYLEKNLSCVFLPSWYWNYIRVALNKIVTYVYMAIVSKSRKTGKAKLVGIASWALDV